MRIISNAALLWAVRLLTLSCSAVLSILTARFLGPGGRGAFTMPAIDASLGTTFAAGLSSAAAYFLLNRQGGRSIVRSGSLVLSIFVFTELFLTLATSVASHSLWAFAAAGAFTVSYAAYSLAYGFYLGFDRARSAGVLNAAAYALTLTFVGIALILNHSSPAFAVIGWVLGMTVTGVVGLSLVFRLARRLEGSIVDVRELLKFAMRAGLVNLGNLLNYRVDIYVVAILAPLSVVGLYTLAVTGAESALSLTIALAQATLPRIGKLEQTEAAVFTARCLRNSIFLAFFLALFGFVAAPAVIHFVFGTAYQSIVAPLRVLLIGLVAASTNAVISNYFVLNRGRTELPLITSLVSTLVCAGLSVALVPRVGMLGAAIGSTVAYISSQAIALTYFCRESHVPWVTTVLVDRRDLALYGRLARRFAAAGSKG